MTHNSVSDLRTYLLSNYVKKLPATFFMFLRFPLTHLDRWLAFFTKIPRNFIFWHMLPDYYLYECYRLLQRCSALETGLEMSVFARSFSGEMQSLNRGLCLVNHSPSPIGAWKVSLSILNCCQKCSPGVVLSRKRISNHDYSGCSKVQAHESFRSRCRLRRNLYLLKAAANCRKACWYPMTTTKTAMAFYCHKYKRSKKKPNAAKINHMATIHFRLMLREVSKHELSLMMRLFTWLMFTSITGVLKMIILFNATHPKIWNLDISISKNY